MPKELSRDDVASFRARICEAATQLYARKGEDAITMRELAKALDCSPMGLYRYFRDRDEIMAFLRADGFNRFSDALEEAFAKGSEPFARARAVGRAYLDFALAHPNTYRLMFDLSQEAIKRYPALAMAGERAAHTVTRHVKDLIKAGVVKGDADSIGHALWAAAHGVIVLHLAGRLPRSTDVETLYFETMRLTFRGARSAPIGRRKQTKLKVVKPARAVAHDRSLSRN
jgi:AcrR family transcriptional regulator